ncbi:MAG: bifunctional riboflavin kinase/FAD synthetase [Pseudohongiellaceae bacterium]
MIVVKDPASFRQYHSRCVATIGKFDGVHLGHQLIIAQLKNRARELELPVLVILIEPHPEEFFAATEDECPARLTILEEKLELLEHYGVDFVFQLTFDRALSRLGAEDYVRDILVSGLGVASFIVGSDFRFGYQRRGDYTLLTTMGEELGFDVQETVTYERNGQRISSTYIRDRLAAGDFPLVALLLGRPYSIKGDVVAGRHLGTDLGFPTCNVNPHRRRIPLHGVFACEALVAGKVLKSAVNIGYRPTVSDGGEALLEAHLLDFHADLYGSRIEVIFRHKIREEQKFDSLDALKKQIADDVERVREYFEGSPINP